MIAFLLRQRFWGQVSNWLLNHDTRRFRNKRSASEAAYAARESFNSFPARCGAQHTPVRKDSGAIDGMRVPVEMPLCAYMKEGGGGEKESCGAEIESQGELAGAIFDGSE